MPKQFTTGFIYKMEVKLHRQRFLESQIHSVLDEFEWIGDDLLAVGGCVRDFLIDREYNDVDIASSKTPQQVIKLARQRGFKVFESGIAHGTVTLQSMRDLSFIEHTTFRKDVSTDGRRATVEFAEKFADDAKRRDFTINSMGINKKAVIYDLYGGINDLKEQVLQFVGSTEQRLAEDRLRALRAFRFACRFDLEIQPDDLYLICRTFEDDFNEHVSIERVLMEIEKAMKLTLDRWYRFTKYLSAYVLPFVFRVENNSSKLMMKISHPSVWENMSYDAFIHNLLWDVNDPVYIEKLPLTVEQKRRIKVAKDLSEMPIDEAIWRNKSVLLDTDSLDIKWFQEFVGFDLKAVKDVLVLTLDLGWPSRLEGKEISDWQYNKFKQFLNSEHPELTPIG